MLAAIVAFAYQILSLLEIVPAVSEDQVTQLVGLVINILVALGIVVDPTTTGVTDSQQVPTWWALWANMHRQPDGSCS